MAHTAHRLTAREEAEAALVAAAAAQTAYWESLSELESALSELAGETVEVDDNRDLQDCTVGDLLDDEGIQ